MKIEEELKHKSHYRCNICGKHSSLDVVVCSCGADLNIYGEVVQPTSSPPEIQPPIITEPPPESNDEEHKKTEENIETSNKVIEPKLPSFSAKTFIKKKNLLIWLDVLFFLSYAVMTFMSSFISGYISDIIILVIAMVASAFISILLAQTEHNIWHGFLCFLIAFETVLTFGTLELMQDEDAVPIFILISVAYIWLAIYSFIPKAAKKHPTRAKHLSKKATLINLDAIIALLCIAFTFFRIIVIKELTHSSVSGEYSLALFIIMTVLLILGILLLKFNHYIIHGIMFLIFSLIWVSIIILLEEIWLFFIDGVPILLYFWLGTISFFKEK